MAEVARHGWESNFPGFHTTPSRAIREQLESFLKNSSPEQIRAWDQSIPQLQTEVQEVLATDGDAPTYSAILEYELPLESRRPDAVLLIRGAVVVVELKGKFSPSQADIDQAAAYARDLRCYHRDCANRPVIAVLVPTLARGYQSFDFGVHVVGPDALDGVIEELVRGSDGPAVDPSSFLSIDAYCPLPTLIQAARELFERRDIRPIHRARAATDPAVERVAEIIHDAARTKSRKLVLITGVPGAGKTLVGLRTVHSHFIDDLAVPRVGGSSGVPAVFLSGNAPLVQVLQYELRRAGGGGKAFVRGVKDYVARYSKSVDAVPPEHVLVFDEAQRAFDKEQVDATHSDSAGAGRGKSEPELFVEFAERIPDWCAVIGLIGSGQEIHVGEEGGIVQWRRAVEGAADSTRWEVHAPEGLREVFSGSSIPYHSERSLNLDTEIRFHAASELHRFVASLLAMESSIALQSIADRLETSGLHLRITRELADAKRYLRDRYADSPDARFGIVASSRDKSLEAFDIPNGFNATKRVQFGPWYSDPEEDSRGQSCRRLTDCVTEFGAQGLELDAALLAWGSDLRWTGERWSSELARRYKQKGRVHDPHQLRVNAYRVLLTRGRDGTVVFVPPLRELDETYERLVSSGFRKI
jgi:hypothetical protein